jgi:hypothetical protein
MSCTTRGRVQMLRRALSPRQNSGERFFYWSPQSETRFESEQATYIKKETSMKSTGWMRKWVVRGLLMMFIGTTSTVYGDPAPSMLQQQITDLESRLSNLEKKPVAEVTLADASGTSGDTATTAKKIDPFSEDDWTWLVGNGRTTSAVMDTKYFTPEVLMDVGYALSLSHPVDHTIVGSGLTNRSNEVQVEHFGVGGDFHVPTGHNGDYIRARILTQLGLYSTAIPRNDATPGVGQWDLTDAYRYVTEMYAGYHFDKMYGVNLDAGIFPSYIGLWSFYEAENWSDTPSFNSSNTPWFFNGVRIQTFPTARFKQEYWIINGWQTYGTANSLPGLGTQTLWRPRGWIDLVSNNYWGHDTPQELNLTQPTTGRMRLHDDSSVIVKYYDHPESMLDKMAFSFTFDAGCEDGGGVSCTGGTAAAPSQYFIAGMAYNRFWFDHDKFALTVGGGVMDNPGRYLILLPSINGATAITGSPYYPQTPGTEFHAWDYSATFDYMPNQWLLYRLEAGHRHTSVPYWEGHNGITPPGGNTGVPGQFVYTQNGAVVGQGSSPVAPAGESLWTPDLVENQNRVSLNLVVKI